MHVAARGGHLNVVTYLTDQQGVDPAESDKNHEDCLTLAIKEKFHELSVYLIGTKRFDLRKKNERSGFDYFSYAVVKGQLHVAHIILEELEAMGLKREDVCNPFVYEDDLTKLTLFDLCM